ncbi:MAG: pyruvate formate lyase family protein [Kiritimatiellae bacterium]|nr:pyruvate formate lyase family protein [Kiritimatiellia bacterium]
MRTSPHKPGPRTRSSAEVLLAVGEPFGAGLCEFPRKSPIERYARAWRRWLEQAPLPAYDGGSLYPRGPAGASDAAVRPNYSFTVNWSREGLMAKASAVSPEERPHLEALASLLDREQSDLPGLNPRHTVGGAAYTHAIVGYDRVLREGLNAYRQRVRAGLARATTAEARAFQRAMLDMLRGIRTWHARVVAAVRASPGDASKRRRLLGALARVPFRPARTFYEAMVAYNLVYYLDGGDNPGRMDQMLMPFYRDPDDEAEALALLGEFADHVSAVRGWSAALGGTRPDGAPAYHALTGIVMRATRGRFRPSLELRVRRDMPDAVWEAAFDALASGNGQPAFYHEEAYLEGLREAKLGIAEEDLSLWNGGGCTETMLHGCSNVGSLDAGFNLPLILSDSLTRHLCDGATFDGLVAAFENDARAEIRDTLRRLNDHLAARARLRPQPMRSLLMDDCIERGRDFNAGGARYNWSVVNVAGLANVADALTALRIVVFERGEWTPDRMRTALAGNFEGQENLRQRLAACPKFGNDDPQVDDLARRLAECVYDEIAAQPCVRGGRFLPSHIMFETYATAGASVGALPDGRRAGEPLADSVGPVQGRDRNGPTALLRSVARLPLRRAIGTPVLNLRFARTLCAGAEGRSRLRALIETFFRMGGMQVQVSLLDRDDLEDAMLHPEKHENLIVRIGGYSTYFNWLSPELKREVIKRTEYGL